MTPKRGPAEAQIPTGREYLNVEQVWDRLNRSISKRKLYALAANKTIRSTRSLGRLLIEWESVEALLETETPADRADDRQGEREPPRDRGAAERIRPGFVLW